MAHSAAVCQWSSRMPPAVRRMSTPASGLETGDSCRGNSGDEPPLGRRLWPKANGYLKGGMPPASVGGGKTELGFAASRTVFVGPGVLLARSLYWEGC